MRHVRSSSSSHSQLDIMLNNSLKSSSSSSHHNDDAESDDHHPIHFRAITSQHSPTSSSSSAHHHHIRGLLVTCAELVSRSDFASVHSLISVLSSNSSPFGDSTERLVHYFSRALVGRIRDESEQYRGGPGGAGLSLSTGFAAARNTVFTNSVCKEHFLHSSSSLSSSSSSSPSSSNTDGFHYLLLNQITPFVRFSHLTANQAILDVTDDRTSHDHTHHQVIHIIDLDVMQGLQWPPLMQALADRTPTPPILRITGFGRDLAVLNQTGDRLSRFAQSLGLTFRFDRILIHDSDPASLTLRLSPSVLSLVPGETLAVNCVLYLHRLLGGSAEPREIAFFLSAIKSLNPRIVTVAEREAAHDDPTLVRRFAEAVEHYGAVFESLEATLPPNSRERMTLEESWFGREISEILAERGTKLRHRRLDSWETVLYGSGFSKVPLSAFALSQAKLLLRLHYPSEGYQLQLVKNALFLGWRNRPLFSVSSWR